MTGTTDWDPERYLRFEDERTRPAMDLLSRVRQATADHVLDVGCGPGNSTELLAHRFPTAQVTGLDSSPAMVAAARERLPGCNFLEGDLVDWKPADPPDIIFANAVLQWLPDHGRLLPALLMRLAPGGTLAVQMPDNLQAPSHRLMREVAAREPWSARAAAADATRTALPPLDTYYDILCPHAPLVEVWRTTYHHPLASPAAIVDWLRATGLRPYLEPLDAEERADFLLRYQAGIDAAYPPRADGTRLLSFERIFLVATRAARHEA